MRGRLLASLCLVVIGSTVAFAQKHEAAFVSGGLKTGSHGFTIPTPGLFRTSAGLSYQLNYSRRLVDGGGAAIYFEFPLIVTPRTKLETSNALLPRSYSSLFFTPGFKLKLVPGSGWSPYAFVGAGFSRLSPSDTLVDGQPNTGDDSPRVRAAYDYGAGLDVKVFSHLCLRGEVRDIYSGTPRFGVDLLNDKQHNFLVGAGLVLRF